jgi:hypothetical protein
MAFLFQVKRLRISRNEGINASCPVLCYVVQQKPAGFLLHVSVSDLKRNLAHE